MRETLLALPLFVFLYITCSYIFNKVKGKVWWSWPRAKNKILQLE